MRLSSPRFLLALLYLFPMIYISTDVFSSMPVTAATIPYVVLFVLAMAMGLVVILGWDYIIPMVVRNFKIGDCKVVDNKYLVCLPRTGGQYVGYVVTKVVPQQVIADMDKDRRMSYLDSIQGLLAGSTYETIIAYVGVKDRFHETVLDRLKRSYNRSLGLTLKETPATRDRLETLRTEIKLLEQQRIILEGFYIAMARVYGSSEDEVTAQLEAITPSLISTLERLGAKVSVLKGEELRDVLMYMIFGNVFQSMM